MGTWLAFWSFPLVDTIITVLPARIDSESGAALVPPSRLVRSFLRVIMAITLSSDTTAQLLASIKRYFAESLEQDIGDLKARLMLDYCLQEIGPVVYNKAIADAQAYFHDRTADLEGACYEQPFTYWDPHTDTRGRGRKSRTLE
jgi:uncharacterized protein (DUF2164 family)